ncbi:phosphopantetheine-binding protein [Actinoalloteichus caeruleus]|uniref:Phosphopantetheine attachment site n=1 Tax=Actinoalloteichus caeruleus DSM 43889 TaxID=1120930 RepID=A0ABT1JE88_ACTCY|nr:phosphopantetheine-binding protein [Actinoalloteichus caeruleus]MCP2330812.1 Phosphopantetheine attachment site [Actinoalloteichus caeruleus DSM 43889]
MSDAAVPPAPSRSTIRETVTRIWSTVLEMPPGRSDLTFFELQGQSISAVRITARIEDELGLTVDVGALFDDPDLDTFLDTVFEGAHGSCAGVREGG